MVERAGEGEIREEVEAVWAVVRRLEAHIRRLEASVSELRSDLERSREVPPADAAVEAEAPVPVAAPSSEPVPVFGQETENGAPRYTLVFDGGSIGNPGRGYGSFQVTNARGDTLADRFDFSPAGEAITNNQAEYLTLIGSLERLRDVLGDRAAGATVDIRGDSQLVINQLLGRWKVNNEELRPLHQRARALLQTFGRTELRWHDRSHSVRTLGH
jgi:probable phosphoglycerate mutase